MSIDPRLIERRKTVAEDQAKKNVSRLLKFLTAVVVVGGGVWLVFSPWLSVSMVATSGIEASDTHATLVEQGVVAGTPMILISAPRVQAALLQDPWVAEAMVRLHWPDEVTVEVVERVPTAWVQTEEGWARRALDGVALPSAPEPDEDLAWIEMPDLADSDAAESAELLGALEFVDALAHDLHQGTVLRRHQGELWATVAGYQVRLGREVDMTQKAASLRALLDKDLPEGSTVVLIAPTNPSVMTPKSQRDGGDESPNAGSDNGDGEANADTEDTNGDT
jgi:hypothetical protein